MYVVSAHVVTVYIVMAYNLYTAEYKLYASEGGEDTLAAPFRNVGTNFNAPMSGCKSPTGPTHLSRTKEKGSRKPKRRTKLDNQLGVRNGVGVTA